MAQDMEDEDHDLEVATYQHRRRRALNERRYAGSIPGRVRIHRDHISGDARIRADYFCAQPVYTDAQFRRRFRMRRHVFERLVLAVQQVDPYFVQRPNCAGELGLSALQKVVAAVRILAYGVPADAVDEYWALMGLYPAGRLIHRAQEPADALARSSRHRAQTQSRAGSR
eukprot:XP_020400111.1 uncharacterized protein LOC109942472 [Zea mays]